MCSCFEPVVWLETLAVPAAAAVQQQCSTRVCHGYRITCCMAPSCHRWQLRQEGADDMLQLGLWNGCDYDALMSAAGALAN
jgi:hypothetical protein